MPGASTAETILYGQTEPRGLVKLVAKTNQLLGVVDNPYPRNFVPDWEWFPNVIVDNAVSGLMPYTSLKQAQVSAVSRQLADQLPRHVLVVPVTPWVESEPQPLHALTIESLPTWAKEKVQNGKPYTRYGEHLGIGIYVYDPERECWYQRAMHGRSICAANRFPLKSEKTAMDKLDGLKKVLEEGSFQVAKDMPEGYPLVLNRLNSSFGV